MDLKSKLFVKLKTKNVCFWKHGTSKMNYSKINLSRFNLGLDQAYFDPLSTFPNASQLCVCIKWR